MDEKKLGIVLETGTLSGGVRVAGEIANRLVRRGWEVTIFSLQPRETMQWFRLDKRIQWYSFYKDGTVRDYLHLEPVLKNWRGLKMATFWRTAPAVARGSAEGEGVYLVQDIETSYTTQPIVASVIMTTYDLPLMKLTTSRWVEENLPGCRYIGIGLDPTYAVQRGAGVRNGRPLGTVRIHGLKGYSQLMEVCRRTNARGIRATLFGPYQRLPSQDFVDFVKHPTDADVVKLYNRFTTFVSTSQHEGFGLPHLEAMACGLVVVTSDADGNREFCQHEQNCLMSDDPAELAQHILEVAANPTKYQHLVEAGLETAKRYQWDDVIQRVEGHLTERLSLL